MTARRPHLLLASSSPRRRDLLRAAGVPFRVVRVDVPEGDDPAENARSKARAAGRRRLPVVAADTIVRLRGRIYGKPKSRPEALRMMRELQGRTHEVVTAVTIRRREAEKTFAVVSRVTFPRMTDAEILAYHARVDPLDKAGAYGLQGMPGVRVRGSRTNVVGLPVERLLAELARLDIRPRG